MSNEELFGEVWSNAGVNSDGEYRIEDVTDNDDRVAIYAEASKIRNRLKNDMTRLQRMIDTLEPEIVDRFQSLGQERVTLRGVTIYLARELWPKVLDDGLVPDGVDLDDLTDDQRSGLQNSARDRLISALSSDPQTEHLVKQSYNHQTLRSFLLHECEENPDTMLPDVPEHLNGILGVTEKYRARVLRK